MTDFRIEGSIEQLGPGRFVATVTAHPASGPGAGQGHCVWEASSSTASAIDALRRMSDELGDRIRAGGGRVLEVELEER